MSKKATTTAPKGKTVHAVLGENGMKIAGWENADCGFGIQFPMPVIVDAETGEKLNVGEVKIPVTKMEPVA